MARRKNHRPDLNGVLVIDKPHGLTSATVCTVLRARTKGARVGHAGTLDPLATGVLVICLGRGCKSVPQIMLMPKRYRAVVDLSCVSPTDDLEVEPTPVDVGLPPTLDEVEGACAQFQGRILQRPPVFSAINVDGKRAHRLARKGELDELPEREVEIHAVDVLSYEWPKLEIDVQCGKGVYIRSLARDLGKALGTGGCLAALERTAIGEYTIDRARSLEEIESPVTQDDLLPAPAPDAPRKEEAPFD